MRHAPTLTTHGSASIRLTPEILLMQVQLVEAAETIAEAISQLKERVVKSRQALEQHEPSVIEFGEALLGKPEPSPENMVARRIAEQRQRRQSKGRHAASDAAFHESPTVRKFLRAQWPLAFDSEEGALTFVYRLQRALATVAGAGSPSREIAEQPGWQTPQEELQSMMADIAPQEPDVRIPQYYYVSQLTDEQYGQLMQEAFVEARKSADYLAQAAGRKTGELQSLSESIVYDHSSHQTLSMRRHTSGIEWPTLRGGKKEIIWDNNRSMQFMVQVSCSYTLI